MKRYRVVLAGALAGLVLVAAYLFAFHLPRAERIDELQTRAEQLRSYQTQLRADIGHLEAIESREREYRRALDRLDELVPSEIDQPAVLRQLEDAADAADVTLQSVSFDDVAIPEDGEAEEFGDAGVLVQVPVTGAVEGSFFPITDLLANIEVDMPRAVLIDTVTLTEAEQGFPSLTGTWSGRVYALVAAEDLPVGDVPRETDGSAPDDAASEDGPADEPTEDSGVTDPPEVP